MAFWSSHLGFSGKSARLAEALADIDKIIVRSCDVRYAYHIT